MMKLTMVVVAMQLMLTVVSSDEAHDYGGNDPVDDSGDKSKMIVINIIKLMLTIVTIKLRRTVIISKLLMEVETNDRGDKNEAVVSDN